jgi:hypothetical protein
MNLLIKIKKNVFLNIFWLAEYSEQKEADCKSFVKTKCALSSQSLSIPCYY